MPISEERKQSVSHGTGGGAATQAGLDYQNRIAAWAAVSILAEQNATPYWDIPANVTFEFIRCETEQPVDDIMIGTSEKGLIFIQAKHTIYLQKSSNSELASTIKQFVRQYMVCRNASGERPWERPLNPEYDRLVLVTGAGSPLTIRQDLKVVLDRVRNQEANLPIEDAAKNKSEKKALSIIISHALNAWLNENGKYPTNEEIRDLLSLIWVTTLDVDPGGSAEVEAKNLLRSTILLNPNNSDSVWSIIIQICTNYARSHSGGNRSTLQKALLDYNVDLKATTSYLADIQRLRQYTAATIDQLADLSTIYVGKSVIKIKRNSTIALKSSAQSCSLVVVGEPGAGKSGALLDVVRELDSDKFDVVFIAVDRIEANSIGTLRNELGISHDFTDVLNNWPGLRPAFLVIDALDAARSEPAIQTFRGLISNIIRSNSRWKVIVSIRKFDLRYNKQLQELFSGEPPTEYIDNEFCKVRHINIPKLDDEELKQIEGQSCDLYNLVFNTSPALIDLLRNVFNLRLMGELIGLNVPIKDLSPISKQIELLDRYWYQRVIREDGLGDAREAVLRKIIEHMVAKRSLKVNRLEVVEPSISLTLKDLLSSQVIAEWQTSTEALPDRYILTFAHHVIYDYAVSRLLLRVTHQEVTKILSSKPELVLAIRPSIVFHFKHLWMEDTIHQLFWMLTEEMMRNNDIPEIGKLIGPSIASELAMRIEDFDLLFDMIDSMDDTKQQFAENACKHLVGALLSIPEKSYHNLIKDKADLWAEFLKRLSRSMRRSVAYIIRPLIVALSEHYKIATENQIECIGITARRLLEFAWGEPLRDHWLVYHALQAVCRSISSNIEESSELIRRSLAQEHMKLYAAEEMPCLAREIENIIYHNAVLAEDIYKAAFTFKEESEEKTSISNSRIIGIVSTRKQDYEMVRYQLAKNYAKFLEIAPINATSALITAINNYVYEVHHLTGDNVVETFTFNGLQAEIRMDYSAIWDVGNAYKHDEPIRMLDIFEKYLIETTRTKELSDIRRDIIQVITLENKLAVLWKRLLKCGIKSPDTIAVEIKSLAWTKPILTCFDTEIVAGDFIRVLFELLNKDERELIENTILSLPEDQILEEQIKNREMDRNRLLGCLSEQYIVTERAKQILEELRSAEALPPNEPHFRISGLSGKPYGEAEYLADKGVPVEEEANKTIRDIEQPVNDFIKEYQNSSPTVEVIQSIFPSICDLYEAIVSADENGVHPLQKDYAWGTLAEACERIAESNHLSEITDVERFVKTVLLEAATHPKPIYKPEMDAKFDEHLSWGKPAPRINAAKGLTLLAYSASCVDETLLKAIISLANDKVPSVRFQVTTHLVALYKTAPEVMWEIIESVCEKEESRGVLKGLLSWTFNRIAGENAERISQLTKKIFDRISDGPGSSSVRKVCVSIFCGLYLWQDNELCRDVVFSMIDNLGDYLDEVCDLVAHSREFLNYGPVGTNNMEQDAIRNRAFGLIERIADLVLGEIKAIEDNKLKNNKKLSHDEEEKLNGLAHIIDTIGSEIYFASGAYYEKSGHLEEYKRTLSLEEKKRFLNEANNIIERLSDFGLFPSVTHHLLETLESFVAIDPINVFIKIGKVITTAQSGGYEYESLAADLIVKIVERYLAEYSWVFRENGQCQRLLLEILDIFVNVGWSSARRLSYRLEEIYR